MFLESGNELTICSLSTSIETGVYHLEYDGFKRTIIYLGDPSDVHEIVTEIVSPLGRRRN